ncbi:PDR/VanB family oxidoreductase [Bradyrhizobium erythrophlei]|uniref:Vanillate O-demethylase ferredoxin subunit n=1 Tax=Bradyrhizobium erythrophlei TaxID=1437360 RepID=A0A1H4WVT9_9BRAD|nr:PDR/VanB family oxidoreductase [Bradyrhizobium erythrophlei]SEC97439.1 vanillate O-demethylase ferredoxin subunit [Bradyrhizobium erythrophlei]
MTTGGEQISARVAEIRTEATDIRSYQLVGANGERLPAFTAGAHIDVFLKSGLVRQYSLVNDPDGDGDYLIAVKRDATGRGGSRELHDTVRRDDVLMISAPRNTFEIADHAPAHIFIAGGIGITPVLSMIRTLARRGATWRLHYCVHDEVGAAFLPMLRQDKYARHSTIHVSGGDPARRLDVEGLTTRAEASGAHLYFCGPPGLMARVNEACADWPAGRLHTESFGAGQQTENQPFDIEIADTGQLIAVSPQDTILDAMRRAGLEVPFLCRQGVCGTCIVDVVDGVPLHRDTVLFDHERTTKIVTCCSWSAGGRLKLAL